MKLFAKFFALVALMAVAHAQAQPPPPSPLPQPAAPPAMRATTPGLARYTDDVLFGEVWKRPGLSLRDRSLVTVSALVATARTQQLTGHAGRALDNGVTPAELAGIVTQLAFYAGWPPAASSVGVLDEMFKARGIDRSTLQPPKDDLLPTPTSEPARAALMDRSVGPVAPALAELTNRVLFDDLWRRRDLSPRDRSLVTIAGLIATGATEQLPFYIARGLENGLTREQLGEAITHLAFYAGWPRALSAVAVLAQATAPAPDHAGQPITIVRSGVESQLVVAVHFTGVVHLDTQFAGTDGARIRGARVTFEPGARTAWHSHPLGQTLIVISGHGWVQRAGGPVEEVGPGDIVWIPPGVKHWHGATPTESMSHVAISENKDGRTMDWMEPVTDAQYRR